MPLPAGVIALVAMAVALFACLNVLSTGSPLALILLAGFPIAVLLATRPNILFGLLVALSLTNLRFPLLPTSLGMSDVLTMLFVAVVMVYRSPGETVFARPFPARRFAKGFAIVIGITMCFRGIGLRALGSETWGGMSYVVILLALMLMLLSDRITLSSRAWRRAVVAMFAFSMLMPFALTLSAFGLTLPSALFTTETVGTMGDFLSSNDRTHDLMRLSVGLGIYLALVPLVLFRRPFRGVASIATWIALGVTFLLIGISGFRARLIEISIILGVWFMVRHGRIQWARGALFAVLAVLLLGVVALGARHLPLAAQRTVSIIPFANISTVARTDALSTTEWRIEVWRRAIREEVPKYWLLGSGFAFNESDVMSIYKQGLWTREWAFITHNYHNGPLSLLITLGIGGLLCGCLFLVVSVFDFKRVLVAPWGDEDLRRAYVVVFALFVAKVAMFFAVYGDTQASFPSFFFFAAILNGMAKCKDRLEPAPVT